MTESHIEYHFGMINGQLKDPKVLLHKDDTATIEYDNENDAEVAIKTYNRRVYDNKTVTLQFTTRPENDPSGDNKLVCTWVDPFVYNVYLFLAYYCFSPRKFDVDTFFAGVL